MRKIFTSLFITITFFSVVNGQSVTPATLNCTGGTNMFTFYRFEWSFGESIAIETMYAPSLYVTNGVLQPGTHNPATNIVSTAWAKEEIKVLPNPVKHVLEIDFFGKQKGKMTMNLVDPLGRMIGTRQFEYFGTGRIEKWNMNQYPSGIYFLEIVLTTAYNVITKKGSFQIVKIN